MLVDYHVHTNYSDDSTYLMEDVVLDAIALKIDEICFCDHVDYGVKYDWEDYRKDRVMNVNYKEYFKEIAYLRNKYPMITLRQGLEFGIQTSTINEFNQLFDKYPLDFVILSVHQINNQELWRYDYQKNKTQDEYVLGYYQELLDVIKVYKNYSVLGHLDLIVRYDEIGNYPFDKIKNVITEILKQVIKDNKGIEINSSCFRYKLGDLTPSKDILKLYKELGGKIITLGSDSHSKGQLTENFNEIKAILNELGFYEFCTFEKMKPIFHLL